MNRASPGQGALLEWDNMNGDLGKGGSGQENLQKNLQPKGAIQKLCQVEAALATCSVKMLINCVRSNLVFSLRGFLKVQGAHFRRNLCQVDLQKLTASPPILLALDSQYACWP